MGNPCFLKRFFFRGSSAKTIPWAKVKDCLRSTLCPPFVDAGFKSSGHIMWRDRGEFLDTLHCWHNGKRPAFSIVAGCQPRGIGSSQPKYWECMFSHPIQHPDSAICIQGNYAFASSIDEQNERLLAIRDFVLADAAAWFAQFTTIESVLASLGAKDFGSLRLDHYAAAGSPRHLADMAALRALANGHS